MSGSIPRVFISYSHDSPDHKDRVLGLSERLRQDGLETRLDQYVHGTPPQKWPRWMLDQLDWANFVLVICTETYYRRFRGHEEPGKGKGADWEGTLITQEIYDACSAITKFVPVIFDPTHKCFIPEPLRGHTFYSPVSEDGYQALYDFLLDQSGIEPGEIGVLKKKPRERGTPLSFESPDQQPPHAPAKRKPLEGLPQPLPAYAHYPPVTLGADMPFDAGLIWGLPRGAFIGLWFGRGQADLVSELRQLERLLQARVPDRYPRRDWFSVELARSSVSESTLPGFLNQAEGSSTGGLPGVVLQTQTLEAREALEYLPAWCRTLCNRVFPNQPLALIVETTAETVNVLPSLRQVLAGFGRPLEILVASRDGFEVLRQAVDKGAGEDQRPAPEPGAPFRAWMRRLEAASSASLPATLVAARRRWGAEATGEVAPCGARALVADLDQWADVRLDQSLMQAVEASWPEQIGPLVRAYALSSRPEARNLALRLAESAPEARERQMVWLTAWVDGAAHLPAGEVAAAVAALGYGHADLGRDLLLAALNRAKQEPTATRRQNVLSEIWHVITPDSALTSVYSYCREQSLTPGQALRQWGASRFALALRAGAQFDLVPADLTELTLDYSDPWWLLTALRPTADLVEAVASLDPGRRAVFGLTSAQELAAVAGEFVQRTMIEECRRGRPLY